MVIMQNSRIWKSIGLAAIISFAVAGSANAGLFSVFKGKSNSAPRARVAASKDGQQSMVIFPLDPVEEIAGFNNEDMLNNIRTKLGSDIASAIKAEISSSKTYLTFLYTRNLAPIKRAKEDSTLKENDLSGPFNNDDGTSRKLAEILATQLYMTGNIDSLTIGGDKKTAEITISVYIRETGKGRELKTLMVTGKTPEGSAAVNEEDAVSLAAGDAVQQLKIALLGAEKDDEKVSKPRKSAEKADNKKAVSKEKGKPEAKADDKAATAADTSATPQESADVATDKSEKTAQ